MEAKRPSSNALLMLIAASFFAGGLLEPTTLASSELEIVITMSQALLLAVLTFLWCRADIKQHHPDVPASWPYSVVLLSILGVALYFFRTRRGWGVLLAIGKMIVFVALCAGLERLGAALV